MDIPTEQLRSLLDELHRITSHEYSLAHANLLLKQENEELLKILASQKLPGE